MYAHTHNVHPCRKGLGLLRSVGGARWTILASARTSLLQARVKILSSLVTQFEVPLKQEILAFILDDIRNRLDLAFAWLYQEYNAYLSQYPTSSLNNYDECLIGLLSGLQEKPDQKDG